MIDIQRAVRSNRVYMKPSQLGWSNRFQEISQLLGIRDQTPTEFWFAEEVANWQAAQKPALGFDGIIGPKTWTRIQPYLGSPPSANGQSAFVNPPLVGPHGREANHIMTVPGPQTFAPAPTGSVTLDQVLVLRNLAIEEELLRYASEYYDAGDLRWFFAYAHGQITKQINDHVERFQRPNALMRLNIHFAEEFIRAMAGQPHENWKRAFDWCERLENTSDETNFLVGEAEFCGAAMASVHIKIDLKAALEEVGCIPPADYGNMLVFVNRGSLAALVKLRGRALGAAEVMVQAIVAPMVDLEVKVWRNAVYENVCNVSVPDPESTFAP